MSWIAILFVIIQYYSTHFLMHALQPRVSRPSEPWCTFSYSGFRLYILGLSICSKNLLVWERRASHSKLSSSFKGRSTASQPRSWRSIPAQTPGTPHPWHSPLHMPQTRWPGVLQCWATWAVCSMPSTSTALQLFVSPRLCASVPNYRHR